MQLHSSFRWFWATAMVALCTGCTSTETVRKAADTALNQLSVYERDVSGKIKAEEDYYETVMNNAAKQVNRLRQIEHPFKLDQEAKAFGDANKGKSADQIAAKIPTFMEQSMNSWAKREAEYKKLLADTRDTLAKNRKALTIERAKISTLKTKLRTLSESHSTDDMLKLVIAFSKEVKTKLDELEDADKKAATGGSVPGGK